MDYARSATKVVATQAFGLFIVFNILVWAICFGFTAFNLITAGNTLAALKKSGHKARLPNYAGIGWAGTHFAEFDSLTADYVSFLGWRRSGPFKGETINLFGPLAQRVTVGTPAPGKPSVYFFGGSTMWGTGADDANTIPSLVTQLGGYASENFAEPGWIAHQNLLLLIKLMQEDHRPDVVVFYDGVNDVLQRCRGEIRPDAHAREPGLRAALRATRAENVHGLQYMLGPLSALANVVSGRISVWFRNEEKHFNRHFACHTDPARAQRVAENLVQDWEIARRLVEGYGGRFIGILQPVSYQSTTTKLDHLKLPRLEGKQYEIVYSLVRQKMAGRPDRYDFTDVLDHPEYIYIDFCHLSPNGNRYVAQKLVEVLGKLEQRGKDEAPQ